MPKVNMNVSVKGDISKTEGTEGALNVLTASHAIEQDAIVKERERKALERGDAEYWKFRSAQLIHMENERRRQAEASAPWYKDDSVQVLLVRCLGFIGLGVWFIYNKMLNKDM